MLVNSALNESFFFFLPSWVEALALNLANSLLRILSQFAHTSLTMDGHFRAPQLFHLFGGIYQMPIYQSAPSLLPRTSTCGRKFTNFCFSGCKAEG